MVPRVKNRVATYIISRQILKGVLDLYCTALYYCGRRRQAPIRRWG